MVASPSSSLHEHVSSVSQWNHHITTSRNFRCLIGDSAVVVHVTWMLQFCCSPALPAIYPLLVSKIAGAIILYSHKVSKLLIVTSNHKRKFTKVTINTLRIHF